MNIVAILGLVSEMMPLVRGLSDVLLREKDSDVPEIIAIVEQAIPQVQGLIQRIDTIKTATEDEFPQVWAQSVANWNDAVSKWNQAQGR